MTARWMAGRRARKLAARRRGTKMTDQTTFTLTLDPDLRDRFVAEADATMRHADDVLREFMRDFVERRRAAGGDETEAEIARAVREADDPSADFVEDDTVGDDWLRQRAALVHRIRNGAA